MVQLAGASLRRESWSYQQPCSRKTSNFGSARTSFFYRRSVVDKYFDSVVDAIAGVMFIMLEIQVVRAQGPRLFQAPSGRMLYGHVIRR